MVHLFALEIVSCDTRKARYRATCWQIHKAVAFLQRREVFGYLDEEPIGALVGAGHLDGGGDEDEKKQ